MKEIDHQKDLFLWSTDFGLKEIERRVFPNDNMFYENRNMGNNSVSVSGVDFTKSRKSKINRKYYRKCDFQAFDWLKFTDY